MGNKIHVELKYKAITWAAHLSGVLLALFTLHTMRLQLNLLVNQYVSTVFIVIGILYLAAVTLRIYNNAHPAPALLQKHFSKPQNSSSGENNE